MMMLSQIVQLMIRMSVMYVVAIILRVQTVTVFQMAMDYLIIVMCVIMILQMTVLKTV